MEENSNNKNKKTKIINNFPTSPQHNKNKRYTKKGYFTDFRDFNNQNEIQIKSKK